jgi:hypothetical protein
MKSIGQVCEELGVPYKRANRWLRELNIGTKVGWGVVLSDDDVEKLKRLLKAKQEAGAGKPGRPLTFGQETPNGSPKAA